MARVSTAVGSFALAAAAATVPVGFRPKAVLLWSVLRTAATGFETADQYQIFGFSDGTNQSAVSHASQTGSLDTSKGHRNDAALVVVNLSNTITYQATVSFASSGFQVSPSVASSHVGALVNFLAIGGDDVSAYVGDVATPGSTGDQAVTGVGFPPEAVIFLAWPFDNAATNASTGFGPNGVGWMTATAQGASSNDTALPPPSAVLTRYQRTDRCVAAAGQGGASYEASRASLDADGFTLTWHTARAGRLPFLALRGAYVEAVAFNAPAVTSSTTLTATTGFPLAMLAMSNGNTASTSRDSNSEFSFGACSHTTQRATWSADRDAAGTTARYQSDAVTLVSANTAGGSITTVESTATATIATRSVILDWTITNADQAQWLGLLIGADSDAPVNYEDPCEITEPRIFATVTTETETIKIGVQPLRDSAALGGYAEPRLIDVSPVTRVASDVATGAWSAQTAAWKWADTDRANRARSATRTSFRGCASELYLTSNAQRLAGLPPRVMFAGTIYEDSADENLVLSTTINDLIGSNYSIFNEEKQIPQRVIEKNWFPNAPDAALGQAEPIVGGRRAPLDPHALAAATLPEGVSKGVYVGQVRIGGAHGTPTGGDLATVVAALEASRAAGTLYTDYGSRIGYSDATVLQGYSSVPSDYDALAQVIGYGDLDALIAETAHTGGDLFEAVVIASHAIAEVLDGFNGDPSIWVGDTQVAAADIGTSVWCPQIPGDTSWASDIGSDLFTDIVGADGTTRRYTLVLFDPGSAHGLAVAGGAVVHVDCIGLEDVGDGTGVAITDAFSLYRHLLDNFILQDYQSGAWLASPQFLFSDGVTLLDRVDADSFDTASAIAALNVTGGYVGSFTIDARVSVRDIVATCNLSWGCLLAQDDYQRLTVKVLDTRRAPFLANKFTGEAHRTLDGKRDILPGFRIDGKPDWQVNKLTYQYAKNNYTGSYERDAGGGGNTVFVEDSDSQERDGVIKKTVEFAYVRDDATADAVAAYYLSLFKDLPRVVTYTRRGLCGLEDDLLDGVPITHWNGYGANGWVDHSVWIIGKTFDPKRMACTFTALDVERVLVEAETAETVYLTSDPVALDDLVADDGSGAFLTEG